VNRDNMGGLSSGTETPHCQSFMVTAYNIHGGSVWWDGPNGSYVYVQGEVDYLRQYKFDRLAGMFELPNFAKAQRALLAGCPEGCWLFPPMAPPLAAASSGPRIRSAEMPMAPSCPAFFTPTRAERGAGIVEFGADQRAGWRGHFAKYCPPTVANGKVYLATFSSQLNVYGLLPIPSLNLSVAASQAVLTWPTNSYYTYKLQANTNLASGTWTDVTNSPAISNGFYQVAVPASAAATFYRLKR